MWAPSGTAAQDSVYTLLWRKRFIEQLTQLIFTELAQLPESMLFPARLLRQNPTFPPLKQLNTKSGFMTETIWLEDPLVFFCAASQSSTICWSFSLKMSSLRANFYTKLDDKILKKRPISIILIGILIICIGDEFLLLFFLTEILLVILIGCI